MLKTCLINPLFTEPMDQRRERYFVRSGSRWPSSYPKPVGKPGRYIPFPFYLAYSAALLENAHVPVSVLDGVAGNLSMKDTLCRVKKEGPDLILFETTTPTLKRDLDLARQLKEATRAEIALAGPHATTFPREILQEESAVDYVLLYEYELTLYELVSKKADTNADLSSIPGIGYRKENQIVLQRHYQPIDPLDRLPFPARHLFPLPGRPDMKTYWDGFCQHRPALQMHASRGCPFRCDFCLWIQVMYRDSPYRIFPPARVVDEMEDVLSRYGAKEIYFDDDDFTVSKKHVLDICREIQSRGLHAPWSCMGDAVVPDEEMLDAMADAGCVGMKFGVESAAPQILKKLGKPVDPDRVINVAQWCSRRKIKTHATFTFGLWDETRETMETSLSFVKSLDVDSVQFSVTAPFPGTRYFRQLLQSGQLVSQDWERYDGSRSAVVAFPNLRPEEIQTFCQKAPARWLSVKLLHPTWLARQIRYLMRLLKGQGLSGVAERIRRMNEILRT